jgi:hypothetical protein
MHSLRIESHCVLKVGNIAAKCTVSVQQLPRNSEGTAVVWQFGRLESVLKGSQATGDRCKNASDGLKSLQMLSTVNLGLAGS